MSFITDEDWKEIKLIYGENNLLFDDMLNNPDPYVKYFWCGKEVKKNITVEEQKKNITVEEQFDFCMRKNVCM